MKEYTVQKPFMCYEGQFKDGERSLCIGIEENALKSAGAYRVYIGKNKIDYYDIDYQTAEQIATYTNRGGRMTMILPLFAFNKGNNEDRKGNAQT